MAPCMFRACAPAQAAPVEGGARTAATGQSQSGQPSCSSASCFRRHTPACWRHTPARARDSRQRTSSSSTAAARPICGRLPLYAPHFWAHGVQVCLRGSRPAELQERRTSPEARSRVRSKKTPGRAQSFCARVHVVVRGRGRHQVRCIKGGTKFAASGWSNPATEGAYLNGSDKSA